MVVKSKHFNSLTPKELYQILKIRQEVFMLEQQIVCSDFDGVDYDAWFVMGIDKSEEDGKIVACARVFKSDDTGTAYIGRVATMKEQRGRHYGSSVMNAALSVAREQLHARQAKIHSQSYIIPFYEKLGFQVSSDEFLEEGVPHRIMTIDI